ncbi:MAG: MmcQ/YjbR family DNA-binding protein [Deltaproteobacteria bacterium]|nr:MmcQ/YjbR family DNA-binding protein [Deltaproteobacteria bacterium]
MKINTRTACEMARSLEGVTEKDHFGSDAFVAFGRMFATVWHDKNEVNLMLSPELQRQVLSIDGEGFAQIDNAWGRAGATKAQLDFVDPKDFAWALKLAWEHASDRAAKRSAKKTTKKKSSVKPAKKRGPRARGSARA